jgi:hypothetical protein
VLRLFLVAPKALGEFGSSDGSHNKTRNLRMMSNLRKIILAVKWLTATGSNRMVATDRFGGDLKSTEFRWRPRAAGLG